MLTVTTMKKSACALLLFLCVVFPSKIDIKGVDRAELFMELYNNAKEYSSDPKEKYPPINALYARKCVGKHLGTWRGKILNIRVPRDEEGDILDASRYKDANREVHIDKIVKRLRGIPTKDDGDTSSTCCCGNCVRKSCRCLCKGLSRCCSLLCKVLCLQCCCNLCKPKCPNAFKRNRNKNKNGQRDTSQPETEDTPDRGQENRSRPDEDLIPNRNQGVPNPGNIGRGMPGAPTGTPGCPGLGASCLGGLLGGFGVYGCLTIAGAGTTIAVSGGAAAAPLGAAAAGLTVRYCCPYCCSAECFNDCCRNCCRCLDDACHNCCLCIQCCLMMGVSSRQKIVKETRVVNVTDEETLERLLDKKMAEKSAAEKKRRKRERTEEKKRRKRDKAEEKKRRKRDKAEEEKRRKRDKAEEKKRRKRDKAEEEKRRKRDKAEEEKKRRKREKAEEKKRRKAQRHETTGVPNIAKK